MSKKLKVFLILSAFSFTCIFPLQAGPVLSLKDKNKIEDITREVFPSVVRVETRNRTRRVATGVVVDKEGYIVTTALIYPRGEKVYVTTSEGKKAEAKFIGMDSMTNIALIRAKDIKLTPIKMGKTQTLSPGSWVGVVSISPDETPAVTQGIVSYMTEDKLRLNVWVVPGASGSPVVDGKGEMVGLLRGAYYEDRPVIFEFKKEEIEGSGFFYSRAEAPSSGMAVAIPVNIVKNIASEIKKKGKVERGWLGVLIVRNEEEEVEIRDVEKNSPADKAGLQRGDVIMEFDGKEITSTHLLAKEIRRRKPGEKVTIKIERDDQVKKFQVELGEHTQRDILREFESKFPKIFPPEPPIPPELPSLRPEKPEIFRWFWDKNKYIGVYLKEINSELAQYFGVKEGKGLLVSKVEEDSPAEEAGIRVGDVIVEAEGKRVEKINDLSRIIQKREEGKTIKIGLIRDKKKNTVEVKLEKQKEEREKGFYKFSKNWDRYSDSMNDYRERVIEKYKQWKERYTKKQREKMEEWMDILNPQRELGEKNARFTFLSGQGVKV